MKAGVKVHWKWGRYIARGTIVKRHVHTTTKKIKGSIITRKADKAEPAYEIKQKNGSKVLKSESELKKG